jgi:CRP/FNR family cyclic AMP-dependent transcriptional regulator
MGVTVRRIFVKQRNLFNTEQNTMNDPQALLRLMKVVELFIGLDDEQLRLLIDISKEYTYDADQVIFKQGDDGDKLYLLRQGQVEISVESEPGKSRSQIFLGTGQVFGEMALIDYGRRSATVRCIRNGTVVDVIERDAFYQLCENNKAIGYVVMRNLATDLSFKLRHRNLDPNAE